jgi:hypothetical protein
MKELEESHPIGLDVEKIRKMKLQELKVPEQSDANNCGVFVLKFASDIGNYKRPSMEKMNPRDFRKSIADVLNEHGYLADEIMKNADNASRVSSIGSSVSSSEESHEASVGRKRVIPSFLKPFYERKRIRLTNYQKS